MLARAVAGLVVAVVVALVPRPCGAQSAADALRSTILSAEDRRAPTDADLRALTDALHHADVSIQRLAVRAVGRLERPALLTTLAPMLVSTDAGVRAEAANAIAQAVSADAAQGATPAASAQARDAIAQASALLQNHLERERDPFVRGVTCESLGRLKYSSASDVQRVEAILVAATHAGPSSTAESQKNAPLPALLGAAKGLESLLRQNARLLKPTQATIARLRALAVESSGAVASGGSLAEARKDADAADAERVRRLALLALAPYSGADEATLDRAMRDEQWELRRVAVRSAAAGLRSPDAETRSERLALVMRGLGDAHWRVRFEALAGLGRNQDAPECRVLLTAVADINPHVSLLAVDLLPKCATGADTARILGGLVRQLPPGPGPWHRPAHALVSLARCVPDQAEAQLGRFVSHPQWQVRAYAARAAGIAKARDVLRTLAADADDNVRTAAVTALADVEQHAADGVFIEQLERRDGQLLITAARALKGTPERARAVPALLKALAATSADHRETSRDVRLALIERVGELASSAQVVAMEPYLRDFDPRVARAAADVLRQWTGVERRVGLGTPPAVPPPTIADVSRLDGARAVVRMKNGGAFTLALFASDAPASVTRFVRLARAGYYNGLTFHRVEPASLIQGGSPGANEYAGDGPFMRDELGMQSNVRGSVGVSTRGRDTGDAQWYINLVDNARYDHNYTVFARVENGMDVVDAILEGDVIEEVRIVGPPGV